MQDIIRIGMKVFPFMRSLTGKGNVKTLKVFQSYIPELQIKSFDCNSNVYDWKVPSEWNVKQAYIEDKNKKKIVNYINQNLHLVSYSIKVNKRITKSELLSHLYSNSKIKNAIPYVTSYYSKRWGFCVSYNQLKEIKKKYNKKDSFKVVVDSNFKKKGKMHYGEILIPGEQKKEILISTNICHPSMANNELSGPLVALKLAKYFSKKRNKRSLRIIFIPETIGSIAYIKKNYKRLKKNIIGGYVITCIGDNRNHSFLYSKYKNSLSDIAALKAYKKLKIKFKKYNFLERGSDERQFNSPKINLNVCSIMRTKYTKFKEYHTSLDNFNVLTKEGVLGGFNVVKESIKFLMRLDLNIEKKKINKNFPISKIMCEPKLSKRGLYTSLSNTSFGNKNKMSLIRKNILNFIQYSDGSNSIEDISKYIKLPLLRTKKIFQICKRNKLVN